MAWVRFSALAANAGVLAFLGAGFVLHGAPPNETKAWLSLIGQAFVPALSLVALWLVKMPEAQKRKPQLRKRKKQPTVIREQPSKQELKDAAHRTKLLQNYKSRLSAYGGSQRNR
jgi:hypothetical protein